MLISPLVLGISSSSLSKSEVSVLNEINPYGLILFTRNIVNKEQLKKLINEVKEKVREDIHILIDQEGGKVQRLDIPHWKRYPSYREIGELYEKSTKAANRLAYNIGRLISNDLVYLGIDINCAPCVDIRYVNTSNILVERIFSSDRNIVYQLANEMIRGFQQGSIVPILKHMPGHGRSSLDSHIELPTIDDPIEELICHDFDPFIKLNNMPIAMTAHIQFSSISDRPVTISKKAIKMIRSIVGFGGLIITDDINMQALAGTLESRVLDAYNAGCNLVLDCSGNNENFIKFLHKIGPIESNIIDLGVNHFKSVQKDEDFQNIDNVFEEYCSILKNNNINVGS
jgi:beta-N-acetylhexosaminidase